MNKREAQSGLCRSTKTPEEVYRNAFSYEPGYTYANSYGLTTGGATTSGTTGGAKRSKLKRNRWGKSEGDTKIADSAAVDRLRDEQI